MILSWTQHIEVMWFFRYVITAQQSSGQTLAYTRALEGRIGHAHIVLEISRYSYGKKRCCAPLSETFLRSRAHIHILRSSLWSVTTRSCWFTASFRTAHLKLHDTYQSPPEMWQSSPDFFSPSVQGRNFVKIIGVAISCT